MFGLIKSVGIWALIKIEITKLGQESQMFPSPPPLCKCQLFCKFQSKAATSFSAADVFVVVVAFYATLLYLLPINFWSTFASAAATSAAADAVVATCCCKDARLLECQCAGIP